MKKYIFLLLSILLVFSGNAFAQPKSGNADFTEKEFMKAVKKADEFKDFKSSFLNNSAVKPKPLIDDSGSQYGWTIQYEIEYNEKNLFLNEDALVNFSSLISFSYEFDNGLKVRLVDYSRLMEDLAFYVNDLRIGEKTKIDVSNDSIFQKYLTEVEINKKQAIEKADENKVEPSENITAAGQLCYYCTKYEWRGGHTCAPAELQSAASVSYQLNENGLTEDGVTPDCYVPRYKVCVAGEWRTYCPIQ
ncbi:hypothetical protein [Cytobacillus sp. NCCP-133]|uniref:hypothetical protein n=1 Tax=Cytobacillus sp. NCCP-133 TaxID=766848 RepID=UPI002232989A|nr:hypothetical protein [Cytobacillus sp. NCCP-133]GLB60469.1 hypothetical protein NCCP133_26010 [Cytobacillus sp. NCCP-133]